MWMKFVIALALALTAVAAGCATSQDPRAANAELISAANAPAHRELIRHFADSAAQGDVDALLDDFGSITLEVNGKQKLAAYLKEKILPFFQGYRGLAKEDDFLKVADNRGNAGVQYYSFIQARDGQRQPFVITLFPENARLVVTSIEVGECLPGYHPSCP